MGTYVRWALSLCIEVLQEQFWERVLQLDFLNTKETKVLPVTEQSLDQCDNYKESMLKEIWKCPQIM